MKRVVSRFLLDVQYQGDGYRGSVHVGEQISHALSMFNGTENFENFTGSSRTDSGVHALRNVWHVDIYLKPEVVISERRSEIVLKALNHYLRKEDIVITDCINVPLTFHCRTQAKYRTYMYRLNSTPSINFKRNLFQNKYAWNVPSLDVEAMQSASRHLLGIHDFSTFRNTGCQSRSAYRHLWALDVSEETSHFGSQRQDALGRDSVNPDPFLLSGNQLVTIKMSANAFVYRMARNIASTLVGVGTGAIVPDSIPQLMAAQDRELIPAAAPARGLFLMDVAYNKEELVI